MLRFNYFNYYSRLVVSSSSHLNRASSRGGFHSTPSCLCSSKEVKSRRKKPQMLPLVMSRLLKVNKKELQYPPAHQLCKLSRGIAMSRVGIDTFEAHMTDKAKTGANPSSHCLKEWEAKKSTQALEQLLNFYSEQLKPEDFYASLNYFLCMYRLAVIMEDVLKNTLRFDKELELLQHHGQSTVSVNPTLYYLIWLAHILNGTRGCLRKADEMLQKHYDAIIKTCLLKDFREFCKEYNGKPVAYSGMPKVFCLGGGDLDIMANKFMTLYNLKDEDKHLLLAHKSTGLWNAGNYSQALAGMATAWDFWLTNCFGNVEMGQDLISGLSDMIKCMSEEDPVKLKPALEFVQIMQEKMTVNSGLPIIPYLMAIHFPDKRQEMMDKYAKLELIQHEKFAKALVNDTVTNETKYWFIGDFLRTVDWQQLVKTDTDAKNEENETNDELVFSPEVVQEMTDIRILELLKDSKLDKIASSVSEHRPLPSDQVLLLAAQAMVKTDIRLLEQLRLVLPLQSPIYDRVSDLEMNNKLLNLHKSWSNGSRLQVMCGLVQQYKSVLEQEYMVSSGKCEDLLVSVRRFVRLYLEEVLMEEEDKDNLMEIVVKAGQEFCNVYNDFGLLTLYWETLFFSANFDHVVQSETFFSENPKVPRHLDIDHLIGRAAKYREESYFRKLLEICLQYDLETYEKSRAIESLLVFQCERGNLMAANATLQSSESLDIPISADAMQVYVDLKRDLQTPLENPRGGILSRIVESFRGGGGDKQP